MRRVAEAAAGAVVGGVDAAAVGAEAAAEAVVGGVDVAVDGAEAEVVAGVVVAVGGVDVAGKDIRRLTLDRRSFRKNITGGARTICAPPVFLNACRAGFVEVLICKPEMHDVAVLNDVLFAFKPHFPGFLGTTLPTE